MAKKYLLYIHADKFDSEEHKSELVNNLLEDWYSGKINNPQKANRKPYHILPAIQLSGKKLVEVIPDLIIKPCKHGADPKFCRFAKSGRPCK